MKFTVSYSSAARCAFPVLAIFVGLLLVPAAPADGSTSRPDSSRTTPAPAALTRGEVVKIVRQEIQRAFKLRNWHRYSSYIGEYTDPDADDLFSLSALDRATAIGNEDAPIRVIVYADYECPYCKRFENQTSSVLHEQFASDALFVFRFFPLGIHGEKARTEAIAGACIARIAGADAFRRFTSWMFDSPAGNSADRKQRLATLSARALHSSDVALDQDTLNRYFENCTNGKTGAALIAPSASFGGVTGTPTIFVVNTSKQKAWRLAGALPTWVFKTLISNVIAGQPGNSDWAVENGHVQVPGL